MNTETLKAALIDALNFGQADHFLDAACQLYDRYETGGLKALENAIFLWRVDLDQMLRSYQKNRQAAEISRQENEAHAREQEARQAAEDRILSGRLTDEEGDWEALESRRYPAQRRAA